MGYCKGCFEKLREIDRLKEEITALKSKLQYEQRKAAEGYFGSSTPSSKKPVKSDSLEKRQKLCGGAKRGHKGHGRSSLKESEADEVKKVEVENTCPSCGANMISKGTRQRTVIDCRPVKMKNIVFQLERRQCPDCGTIITARAPGVLPKCLYGNQLLTYVAVQHYIQGTTLGQLKNRPESVTEV